MSDWEGWNNTGLESHWPFLNHDGYVVKCEHDAIHEPDYTLSQHKLGTKVKLPRDCVNARKPQGFQPGRSPQVLHP